MALNAAAKRSAETADPEFVRGVLDSIFENVTEYGPRRHYEEFLADSIEMLARHHPGRWGVTVFPDKICLNSGMVECLVLHLQGLRVLLDESIAPAGVKVEPTRYR